MDDIEEMIWRTVRQMDEDDVLDELDYFRECADDHEDGYLYLVFLEAEAKERKLI